MQNGIESDESNQSDERRAAPETPLRQPNPSPAATRTEEIGGPTGPEPTRYGDWEKKGRCIDF